METSLALLEEMSQEELTDFINEHGQVISQSSCNAKNI